MLRLMRLESSLALVLVAACSSAAPPPVPVSPTAPPAPAPAAPEARVEPPQEYSCLELGSRPVSVDLEAGYSTEDVARWLIAWSCRTVVVPLHVRRRRATAGFSELVEARDLPRVLDQLLAGLKLTAITDGRVTVFVKSDPRLGAGKPELVWTPRDPPKRLALELAPDAITELGNGRYRISRSGLEVALADPATLSRGARIVPAIKNGKPYGFKLYAIRSSSVYARLGLKNGDTIHRVNGHDLTSAEQALEIYTKLAGATEIRLSVIRRGKPVELTYEIR